MKYKRIFNENIPIKHEGTLVGWVIKKMTDGEMYYQFTTVFVEEVNRIADYDTEFAIIYGYDTSYVYDDICLNSREPVYFSCDVEYVSQPKGSELCWADSTACIVNYLKNMELRATAVAIKWYE